MKFSPRQKLPKPPAHLSAARKKWFRAIVEKFVLEEHHVELLIGCAEALDRAEQAREAIARDGAYFSNPFGEIRKHPALTVEKDAKTTYARLLRELGLDIAEEAPRPPSIQGDAVPRPQRRGRDRYQELTNTAIFMASDALWGDADDLDFIEQMLYSPTSDRQAAAVCRAVWELIRLELLPAWIKVSPGTRPNWWWCFDAPRFSAAEVERRQWAGWFFVETLPDPRRQVGGSGVTAFDHDSNHVPAFDYGIPKYWHSIDPDDPPQFESQAAYLDKHGLLMPAERRVLTSKDFQPQTISDTGKRK